MPSGKPERKEGELAGEEAKKRTASPASLMPSHSHSGHHQVPIMPPITATGSGPSDDRDDSSDGSDSRRSRRKKPRVGPFVVLSYPIVFCNCTSTVNTLCSYFRCLMLNL